MKNHSLKLVLVFLWMGYSISVSGQNTILFSGNISNCPESKFEFLRTDQTSDYEEHNFVKIKDGKFSTVLNIKEPSNFRFIIGKKEFDFYATPGDSLFLTADYNKIWTTIQFSGKGNKTAQFYTVWKSKFRAAHKACLEKSKDCSPEDYLELRKNLLNSELIFLNDYISQNKISDSLFFNHYYTDFKFSFNSGLCDYIKEHSDIEKEGVKPECLPLLKILDETDYNDPHTTETSAYRCFFITYINLIKYRQLIYQKALPPIGKDSVAWYLRTYALSKKILPPKAHEGYVMTLLFEFINPITVTQLAPLYSHFIQSCSPDNRIILENAFQKYHKLNKVHKISDNTQIKKTEGGLESILSQFKGSILYVDFWASWCAPCIEEMSYSKEIQKKFDMKNVKFIFISVDQNDDSWQKAISTYQIPGIHFRLDTKYTPDLQKSLLSKGIPHYLIVGKDGKIIDADAKKPSNSQLISDLKKLLDK